MTENDWKWPRSTESPWEEGEKVLKLLEWEDDKRATTKVQDPLVFFFLFSFILLRKALILRESPGGKSVKKCENVPNRFCPLVVAL